METLDQIEVLRDSGSVGDDRCVLKFRELRDVDRGDIREERVDLLAPLRVQTVPVREIVPRTLLEEREAPLDFRGIEDRYGADVDAAVDDPMIDAEHGGHGEDARVVGTERHVRRLRRDRIERGHGLGEMHPVVKPKSLVVALPDLRKIRVELRVLRTGDGLDLRGKRERDRFRFHGSPY